MNENSLESYFFNLEFLGVLFGIISVILIIKENIWCWFFGIINVSLLMILFFKEKIFGQFVLQIFFLVLQFYGYFTWKNSTSNDLKIRNLRTLKEYSILFLIIVFTSFILYLGLYDFNFFSKLETNKISLRIALDVFITATSFVAQYLQARKILENWILWILVDIFSIYLFYKSNLYMVTFFYSILLILASIGFFTWRNKWKKLA